MSKFKLAFVEIYNPDIHGTIKGSIKKNIYNSFIVKDTIEINEFYENLSNINEDITYLNEGYNYAIQNKHIFIRNYNNIITNNYFKIEIIEENNNLKNISLAIKKTYLIKIIQKKWRTVLKERHTVRKNIKNLFYREIHGKFPKECNIPFKLGFY